MTRSEQRQQILALTFEKSFKDETLPEIIENAIESRNLKTSAFVERSVNGIFDHLEQIDELISDCSIGWKLNRIPRVSLAVMRICVYEMLFESDIPVSASINEAVELVKKYGGDGDPSYVNGVLGAVAKKITS